MAESRDEQLISRPTGTENQPAKAPHIEIIDTSTYQKIAERYITRHKVKEDIAAGDLDLSFPEAVRLMAEALADFFHDRGSVYGIETQLPGEIRNLAVMGFTEDGNKVSPGNRAFQVSLGKMRTERILKGIEERVHRLAARRDVDGQRRLRAQLVGYKNGTNFTKIGAGNAHTIASAIDHAIERVSMASDRGGGATLAADILNRIETCRAAEERTTAPAFAAVRAASVPAEISVLANSVAMGRTSGLDTLLRWDPTLEYEEITSLEGVVALAKQCAVMENLPNEQLDVLSDDVARRIHHPFGLMNTAGHADMIGALYLYTGEAPYEVMKLALAYIEASGAEACIATREFGQLVDSVQSGLEKAIKKSRVRWMSKISVRPAAVDALRLLAAVVAKATDRGQDPVWPDGLLEEVLIGYEVDAADIPVAVSLLKKVFSMDPALRAIIWWPPSSKWNTIGCRILEKIATFDDLMSSEDREDLKAKAMQVLPYNRLSELRDNLVRAESEFSQTVRPGKDRSTFTHESLLGTNRWLWRFGNQQATTFFTDVKAEKENAHRQLRGMTAGRLSTDNQNRAQQGGPSKHVGPSPKDWFAVASSKNGIDALMQSGARSTMPAKSRTTADILLEILSRTENFPYTRPTAGRSIPEWIDERIEEFNLLEEEYDNLIHPSESRELCDLLEATVRALIEKETGK